MLSVSSTFEYAGFLDALRARSVEAASAHYHAADHDNRLQAFLGIATSILALFLAVGFASTFFWPFTEFAVKSVVMSIVSVLVACLTLLQSFTRLPEIAERHRAAAARYGALGRKVELILLGAGKMGPGLPVTCGNW